MHPYDIIVKPIVTEKSMSGSGVSKFSFMVSRYTNKTDIKIAINSTFNVHVQRITTSIIKGKTKNVGAKRQTIKEPVWKRAVVTLKKGEKISFVEPVLEEKGKKKKK